MATKQDLPSTRSADATAQPPASLLDVIRILFRWKKTLILVALIAGIGSAAIVLLLPVYYQANTLFFATSPDQATPELLFGDGGIAPELYGNENDIDRILTIAESNELIDFLVDSFNLYQHYDIDPDSPRGEHYVRKTFRGLYDVTKTKRDAIQLSVEDQDPELAAAIAQAARNKINTLGQNLIKSTQQRSIATFEQDIIAKSGQLQALSDTLERLRRDYGIFNSEAQSESLTSLAALTETRLNSSQSKLASFQQKGGRFRDSVAVYEVKVEALTEEMIKLEQKLERFNNGLSRVLTFTRQYQEANSSLSEDKEKLKQYQAIYQSDIPALILVEEASIPMIKSRPFRTLVVLASVVIALFFTLIGILIAEAYREVDWRSIVNG